MSSDKKNINLTIDGIPVTVPAGTSILDAARKANIKIPTLCHHPHLPKQAICRICVVELDGENKLAASCANSGWDGANVVTNNTRVRGIRKTIIELLLSNHPQECLRCVKNNNCELQSLAADFGICASPFHEDISPKRVPAETANEILVRDMDKCVKCRRCVEVCQEVQAVRAINSVYRSIHYRITTPYGQNLAEGPCIFCGQCAAICPVGAIYEYDETAELWAALNDDEQYVAVQIAPTLKGALENELGLPPDSVTSGKIVTALKLMGFDIVLDAVYFADLAIMEEGSELLDRVESSTLLPILRGCSPGWIKFVKDSYPDLLDHLPASKSPQHLFGALVKLNSSQSSNVDRTKISTVSITPCMAQKFEVRNQETEGVRDLDFALTHHELARMIRIAGIDLPNLPESPFGSAKSGDGKSDTIKLDTGGNDKAGPAAVMKSLLHWVYEAYTGETIESEEFREERQGIKEVEVDLTGTAVKIMVVNGLANARTVMDSIRRGECNAAFVEVMNCPRACSSINYPARL